MELKSSTIVQLLEGKINKNKLPKYNEELHTIVTRERRTKYWMEERW